MHDWMRSYFRPGERQARDTLMAITIGLSFITGSRKGCVSQIPKEMLVILKDITRLLTGHHPLRRHLNKMEVYKETLFAKVSDHKKTINLWTTKTQSTRFWQTSVKGSVHIKTGNMNIGVGVIRSNYQKLKTDSLVKIDR